MNRNNLNHLKETRQENLLALKRAIDNKYLNEIVEFNGEWCGSYVIITSSQEKIYNPETMKMTGMAANPNAPMS